MLHIFKYLCNQGDSETTKQSKIFFGKGCFSKVKLSEAQLYLNCLD